MSEALQQKDEEIVSLNGCIENLKNLINSLRREYSTVCNEKIAELNKHNRRLSAQFLDLKSKCKKVEGNQRELEKLLELKEEQLKQIVEAPPAPSELQILTEKLEKANKKVFEALNQNSQLKNELQVAQKCIQQEVGESVSVAQLMSGTSNRVGRAQQIFMLNSKIAELKKKCEETARNPPKRLEGVRLQEVEALTKDLGEFKAQLEDVKKKSAALKLRNKNLVDEANDYKLKTLDLMVKTNRDEEFIKCLKNQMVTANCEHNDKLEAMKQEVEQFEKLKLAAEHEAQSLRCELKNQEQLSKEKIDEISQLKVAIDQLESNVRDVSGDFLFSCRQMSKDEYISLLKNLEVEKGNLLDYMKQLNQRLSKESEKVSEQHEQMTKQRLKISRLEAKLREVEAEKEAVKERNRRASRVKEYSGNQSCSSLTSSRSSQQPTERTTNQLDKFKLK